jgi:competence protein ComEA
MKKTYIIIIVILIFLGGIYYLVNNNQKVEYDNIYLTESNIETENIIQETSKIKIHITGEVLNPGMYEVEEGARIDDAIKTAGGATENADFNKVNLAYELSDGEKIYIPSIFDEEDEYTVSSNEEKTSSKININKATSEELQTITGIGPSLASKIIEYRENNGKFSSIEELKNVSGIGDKKYESIKEYIVVK